MTPQERQLVDQMFDRLAGLENAPRDPQAARAIADGVARAPHALYALVQTVLVQDEALRQAEARIRDLQGGEQPAAGGRFIERTRNATTGRSSVPNVRSAGVDQPDARWNSGGALPQGGQRGFQQQAAPGAQRQPASGGSFLGTAAATAAGVIGGSLLFNSLGGMFGNKDGSAQAATPQDAASPWGDNKDSAGSDLARDAGAGDVSDSRSSGLFDDDGHTNLADSGDFGGDFGDV